MLSASPRGQFMVTLYSSPGTAGLVVHWLLIELGIAHELRMLDFDKREHKTPEYLAINPNGVVPTLVIDGEAIFESPAIAMQLADAYPAANLAPAIGSASRARYYQWFFFMANYLQPAYRLWFYAAEGAGEANSAATQEQARARIESGWNTLDKHLAANGPYLLGEQLTAADFMMTMLMRWSRNMPKPAHTWPALAEHARRMKARPSFRELYAREGLTEWS
jgi:glutathione S-transferase